MLIGSGGRSRKSEVGSMKSEVGGQKAYKRGFSFRFHTSDFLLQSLLVHLLWQMQFLRRKFVDTKNNL